MPRTRSGFEIALGLLAYAVAAAGAVMMFWGCGHASVSLDPVGGGVALMGVGVAVLVSRRLIYGPTGAGPVRFWTGVLVIPALLVATVILGTGGVAMNLRWHGSESAFRAEVASFQHGKPVPGSVQIGSYAIDRIDVAGSGYVFEDAHGGDLTDCGGGFAYLPSGTPRELRAQYMFVPLDRGWYTWTCAS